jgi:hypothetical protein
MDGNVLISNSKPNKAWSQLSESSKWCWDLRRGSWSKSERPLAPWQLDKCLLPSLIGIEGSQNCREYPLGRYWYTGIPMATLGVAGLWYSIKTGKWWYSEVFEFDEDYNRSYIVWSLSLRFASSSHILILVLGARCS